MSTHAPAHLDLILPEIRTATGGKILHEGAPAPFLSSFTSDSRKAHPGCVFLCIPGAQVDGHDFIPQAAKAGAAVVIGQNKAKLEALVAGYPQISFVCVADVLQSLQSLATYYRKKFDVPVVGLTGSSGKTTTKDLIASILNPPHQAPKALITEGTLNNHWGVPQMVLHLRAGHKAAVFEMGMSDFGEIAQLAAIAQPSIGYITAIGPAHLEKLGSVQGVLKAKRELFDWIEAHTEKGTLLFNLDDPLLKSLHAELGGKTKSKTLTLSLDSKADFSLGKSTLLGADDRFGWAYAFHTPSGEVAGTLPLPGRHNLANALAAAALVFLTKAGGKHEIQEGLKSPTISSLRSDIFRAKSGAVIYNDSYNANPTSVAALFDAARLMREQQDNGFQNIIAAVGDMLELGPQANELHRAMGKKAAECGVTSMLALGHHAAHWLDGFKNSVHAAGSARAFSSHDALAQELLHEIAKAPKQTLVLIKGSRGAKMDLVANKLKGSE